MIDFELLRKICVSRRNSKMPGFSFGLPRFSCIRYRPAPFESSVCEHCYAKGGGYNRWTTERLLMKRAALVDQLLTERKPEVIAAAIASRINTARGDRKYFFRWFDIGDIYRPELVDVIRITAERCPQTKFWVSTRAWKNPIILKRLKEVVAQYPNVIIRPSADHIDQDPPRIEGLAAGTGVFRERKIPEGKYVLCSGNCRKTGCRICWIAPNVPVFYPLHKNLVAGDCRL